MVDVCVPLKLETLCKNLQKRKAFLNKGLHCSGAGSGGKVSESKGLHCMSFVHIHRRDMTSSGNYR